MDDQAPRKEKTVAVLSFTNLETDPRVNRQIRWLASRYSVVAVGLADPRIPGVRFVPCRFESRGFAGKLGVLLRLLFRRHEAHYWSQAHHRQARELLSGMTLDAIVANDLEALPVVLAAANGSPVIMDAHEYAPREFDDRLWWRLLVQPYKTALCRRYLPKADAMVTVCGGIATEYHQRFGVQPGVITNAPDYEELEPHPTESTRIRMIHHGGAARSRRIETMVRMMDHLDARFELDLMLVPDAGGYVDELKRLAAGNSRIRFLPPVPMREIARTISAYDLGLYLLEPSSFNNRMALPNKFFEFIQARLAVAIGPSPEMARVVRTHGLGVVADAFTPESLAEALNRLDASQIDAFKARSHAVARELSSERNAEQFLALVERVIGKPTCAESLR